MQCNQEHRETRTRTREVGSKEQQNIDDCAQTGNLFCELTSNLSGVLGIHGEGSRGQGHPRPEGPGGGGVCAGKGENKVMEETPTLIQDEEPEVG